MTRKSKRKPSSKEEMELFPLQDFSNVPYTLMRLSTAVLISGQAYQRPIKRRVVDKIVNEFDPQLLDEIIVNERNGKYYIVDGQHRAIGLREKNDGHDVIANCKVYHGLTYEQEADLYHKLDRSKTRLNTKDNVRSMCESGNYPHIEDIKKVLKANDIVWKLSAGGGAMSNNQLSAIRETINAYDDLGFSEFARMIKLIKMTWNGDRKSLTTYILSGMTLFFSLYSSEIDDAVFVRQFSKVRPQDIVSQGRTDASTTSAKLKYGKVIWQRYNYQRHSNQKLPYRFDG